MDLYFYFVVLLFMLAAVDLIVGVSNDAVNFLNSAIGSKVASYRTILIIASIGILIGSVFSNGMMQIARNGIFEPSYFTFEQVMFILMAVMLTDIILLDFYNSVGLPTSTTVSLIFELLGASFAVGLLVIYTVGENASRLSEFINIDSAVVIIGGIFLSVLISFVVGSIIQYFARMLFTFRIVKSVRRWGALYAGIAITTIIYFLLIKGAKGSAIISAEHSKWIVSHTWHIMVSCVIGFTLLISVLMYWRDVSPLKIIVLLGTFSLAMAFAGNDLVNFIGVSIAGLNSYQAYIHSGVDAGAMSMGILNESVRTPFWILLTAGLVMVVTLWTNAKSRKVSETEVSLGNQDAVDERFRPNNLSRWLVGGTIVIGRGISLLIPKNLQKKIEKRFQRKKSKKQGKASFDLVRASINLVVASALIAFGTANKLPLSTTFVTFMVSMGTSFADQAWGRESAVYRVAGVLKVIGGWLLTALLAFCGSAIVAFVLFTTQTAGVISLAAVAAFLLVRSHVRFSRRMAKEKKISTPIFHFTADSGSLVKEHTKEIITSFNNVHDILKACIQSLQASEVKPLKNVKSQLKEMIEENSKLNDKIIKYISKLDGAPSSIAKNYLLVFDRMQNIHQSCLLISEVCVTHVSNHHDLPDKDYYDSLNEIHASFHSFIRLVNNSLGETERSRAVTIEDRRIDIRARIEDVLENQIYLLKKGKIGNRLALLQIRVLLEMNDILKEIIEIWRMFSVFKSERSKKTSGH